jgi:DNA-binding MarR family transcriptional regulator
MEDRMPDRDVGKDISTDVLVCLRRIIQLIDRHSKYLIKTVGLSIPQLTILHEVACKREQSASQIARAVSLSQATVTGIIDRLERRGLIERSRDHLDRRKVLVRPTHHCLEMLTKTPPLLQESFIDALKDLQAWEQSMILSSLQRLLALMESKKIDPLVTD